MPAWLIFLLNIFYRNLSFKCEKIDYPILTFSIKFTFQRRGNNCDTCNGQLAHISTSIENYKLIGIQECAARAYKMSLLLNDIEIYLMLNHTVVQTRSGNAMSAVCHGAIWWWFKSKMALTVTVIIVWQLLQHAYHIITPFPLFHYCDICVENIVDMRVKISYFWRWRFDVNFNWVPIVD